MPGRRRLGRFIACAGIAVLCGWPAGCGKTGKTTDPKADKRTDPLPVDHSRPDAIAADLRKATKAKDWPTVFECLTTESRLKLLSTTHQPAAMTTTGDGARVSEFNAILKSHGVDPSKGSKGLTSAEKQGALFSDMLDWIERSSPGSLDADLIPLFDRLREFAKSEPAEFQIDGDNAATSYKSNRIPNARIHLTRIDGKWLVDLKRSLGPEKKEGS